MKKKIIVSAVLWLGAFFCSCILCAMPLAPFQENVYRFNTEPVLSYKIIPAAHNTWGYDILKDGAIFIHQPNKPGLPGNDGFSTRQDAIKVAQLVIAKINRGEMPPTISTEELKALKLAN